MKTIRICLVLILTVGLFGCLNSTSNSIDDSYAVYSVILKDIKHSPHDGSEINLFVINEITEVDKVTPTDKALPNLNPQPPFSYVDEIYKDAKELLLKQKPSLPSEYKQAISAEYKQAIEDFKINNKESQQLTKSFDLKQNYVLISRNDIRTIMSGKNLEDNWKSFYDKYPNSTGFITFSRVGFDAEKKLAFVYFEQSCGSLCASGSYILLEKDAGIWKQKAQQPIWVS